MAGSSIGTIFKLSTFGESHGVAIGGVIDGVPANCPINLDEIQMELDRRKPGQSKLVTQRKESDLVQILSGVFEGKTTGTPIGFIIQNNDAKSKDYDHIKDVYRPSHADYTYDKKYGVRDHRGGEGPLQERQLLELLLEQSQNKFFQFTVLIFWLM